MNKNYNPDSNERIKLNGEAVMRGNENLPMMFFNLTGLQYEENNEEHWNYLKRQSQLHHLTNNETTLTTLNKTDVKAFNEGRERYYTTVINLTAPIGQKTANALLGNLTSKLAGNYPLLQGKVEVIDYHSNVARVKWTQLQCGELNKDLEDSFAELEKLKCDGKISDWKQVSK